MTSLPKLGEARCGVFRIGGFCATLTTDHQNLASKHTPNLDKARPTFTMLVYILKSPFTISLPRFVSIVSIENKIRSYKYQLYIHIRFLYKHYCVSSEVHTSRPTSKGCYAL